MGHQQGACGPRGSDRGNSLSSSMEETPNKQRGQPSQLNQEIMEHKSTSWQFQLLSSRANSHQTQKRHHCREQRSQPSTNVGLTCLFPSAVGQWVVLMLYTEKPPHKTNRRKAEILTDDLKGTVAHLCQIGMNFVSFCFFLSLW